MLVLKESRMSANLTKRMNLGRSGVFMHARLAPWWRAENYEDAVSTSCSLAAYPFGQENLTRTARRC